MNKNWPLEAVKRWGGWSKNEGQLTLVNYVLNEYSEK